MLPFAVLSLGCRTIGSDPWRSAQTEAPLETTASLEGISFSCSKGSESKYEVDGASIINNPAFGFGTTSSVVKAVLPEWTPDSSLPLAIGGPTGRSSWGPDAKLRRAPRRR